MDSGIDRRKFLKTSVQGAAAAGLASATGRLQLLTAAEANRVQLENPSAWITSIIRDYTATSPSNSLRNETKEKAWDEPMVGFCRGDDPIFQSYKDRVGPFHWTPLEIFQLAFPDVQAKAEELTVISWILPHTEAIKADLRKETKNPSEKWIRARIYGEQFNEELRRYVAETLTRSGYHSVAPTLFPSFKTENSPRYGMASSWSERHAAYAAGLGTFGLCDGLITPKGKAIRCGSIVARIRLASTPRLYEDHHAYCLFFTKGICGVCSTRCPAGAVTKSGHNKIVCAKQCNATAQYADKQYGLKGYGCGFCQTGVPCESRIPV